MSRVNKKKNNIANVFFGLSGLIILGYIGICFLPITNDASVVQNITTVNAPISGVVQQLNKGKDILLIHPTQANASYQETLAQQQQALLNVSLVEQQIKVLQLDLTMTNDELVRLQDEFTVYKTQQDVDSKVINQLAHAIKIQQSQVAKVKQQITAALLERDKAKLDVATVDKTREQSLLNAHDVLVKAPVDGIMQNLLVESGSKVVDGQKIFDFVDTSQTIIKANFAETDLSKIKAGARVLVFPRAYLGSKIFHGIVLAENAVKLDSQSANLSNATAVSNAWLKQPERLPVMIKVLDSDDNHRLLSGMSAYVYVQG